MSLPSAWRDLNYKLRTTFIGAAAISLVLLGLLIVWHNAYCVAAGLLGVLTGWGIGILLAPYEGELKGFRSVGKGLAGFVAGAGLSQISQIFASLDNTKKSALTSELALRCYLTFSICLITSLIVVFVGRSYWQAEE